MQLVISCPGGCAPLLKSELKTLGYNLSQVLSPSTLQLEADESAIAKINLRSRIANKVYLVLAQWISPTFERLFDIVHRVDRKMYIAEKTPVTVNARSNNSLLTSLPSVQSMGKKSISKKLTGNDERREEDPSIEPIEILLSLENNNLQVLLNTTGTSLHRRGYRTHTGEAPLKENLAAALVMTTWRKFRDPFIDLMCGAGTLPIEAAMIAKNIAPGLKRNFAFENFARYSKDLLAHEKEKAMNDIITTKDHLIKWFDIDATMIAIAKENALNAWVSEYIEFSVSDALHYKPGDTPHCFISNPPYGERMQPANLAGLYAFFDGLFIQPSVYGGIVTSYERQPRWDRDPKTFYNGPDKVTFRKKKIS